MQQDISNQDGVAGSEVEYFFPLDQKGFRNERVRRSSSLSQLRDPMRCEGKGCVIFFLFFSNCKVWPAFVFSPHEPPFAAVTEAKLYQPLRCFPLPNRKFQCLCHISVRLDGKCL